MPGCPGPSLDKSVQAPWVAGCGPKHGCDTKEERYIYIYQNIYIYMLKMLDWPSAFFKHEAGQQATLYSSECLLTLHCLPPATRLRVAVAKSVPRGGRTPPTLPCHSLSKGNAHHSAYQVPFSTLCTSKRPWASPLQAGSQQLPGHPSQCCCDPLSKALF